MNVLLLRARDDESPDRYEAAFEARGYVALSVPALETVLVHVDELRDKIVRGPSALDLSGVILTSKRAVQAWCEAIQSIPPDAETSQADWRTVPFYVVGDATAVAASLICSTFPTMAHLAPSADRIRGGSAGTGERLAAFILAEGHKGQCMLYLTTDKHRETLPEALSAGGVALEMLEVYRTAGSTTFRDDLRTALARTTAGATATDRGAWGWVVHFAPSAVAHVAPILDEVFCPGALKVAVIGPTTASFLRDTLNAPVHVVAPRPSPDALCGAVLAYDGLA